MAQGDILKRFLDAGVAFSQMTRERAEAIVQDLVDAGEIRSKEAKKRIDELLERSQKNTEELLSVVRREVAEQLRNMGLDDLAKRAGAREASANPTSVGSAPSETPNAADDAYPAPASPAIKQAAKRATKPAGTAKKTPAGTAKKTPAGTAKKTGTAKKAATPTSRAAKKPGGPAPATNA